MKVKEYQQEKEAIKAIEEQAKFNYKIIQVTNTLKRM
jgi:hypothetical protein